MGEVQEVLRQIAVAESDRGAFDPLQLLVNARTGATGSELVDRHDAQRATVYRWLNALKECGFVVRSDDEFRTIRAGHIAGECYRGFAPEIGYEQIAYLAHSESRAELLRALMESPASKATLADRETLPSRSTIHRTFSKYTEWGWVERTTDGRYELPPEAAGRFEQYLQLKSQLDQIAAKSDFFNRLAYWAEPPLNLLDETRLVRNTEEQPYATLDAAIDLANIRREGLEHVRSVTPVFDPVIYDVFGQFVEKDTIFEIIFDQRTYEQLTQPRNLHYFAGAVLAPNVNVRIHPDTLYSGLGIYNQEAVMLGGSTRHEQDIVIVGDTDDVREWATETFEQLWDESASPSSRLIEWLNRTAPLVGG